MRVICALTKCGVCLLPTQTTMDDVVAELKAEVAESASGMEGAALAGLGLTEMLNKLKDDHAAAVRDLEEKLEASQNEFTKSQEELEDVSQQLEERNTMLTGVMEFLQKQQDDAAAAAGVNGCFDKTP